MSKKHLAKSGARDGFTLIELLVVICIIGILALVAVGSYAGVQIQARIDFGADTLVATFREAQEMARSGHRNTNADNVPTTLQCYAIKIVTGAKAAAAGGALFTANTDYVSLSQDKQTVDSCTPVAADTDWRPSPIFQDTLLILGEGEEYVYYFKPPFSQIYQWQDNAMKALSGQDVLFTVENPDHPQWDRKVLFSPVTGLVEKVISGS